MNPVDYIAGKFFKAGNEDRLSSKNVIYFILAPLLIALTLVLLDIPFFSDAVIVAYGVIYVPITFRIFRHQAQASIASIFTFSYAVISAFSVFAGLLILFGYVVNFMSELDGYYFGGADGLIAPTLSLIITPILLFARLRKN